MRKYILILIYSLCIYNLCAEEIPNFNKKPVLLVLASNKQETDIQNKFSKIAINAASNLKRFQVIDRSNVNKIIEEQRFQHAGLTDTSLVQLGKMLSAKEALIVDVINFGQKGVPVVSDSDSDEKDSSSDDKFGMWLLKEVIKSELNKDNQDNEQYPNNIQTSFRGEIRKLNLETGEILSSIQINAEHTGGVKSKSLNKTLDLIYSQVINKLKQMYLIETEVLELINNRKLRIFFGENRGIVPGSIYSIYTPDSLRKVRRSGQIEQIEITIPGKEIALIAISESSEDISNAKILRKWGRVKKGYKVQELPSRPFVVGASLAQGLNDESVSLNVSISPIRLNKFNFDFNIGIGTVYTKREIVEGFEHQNNFLFELGVGLGYNFIDFNLLKLQPHLYIPFGFVSRSDDNSQPVSSIAINPRVGLIASIMIKRNLDLMIGIENFIFDKPFQKWSIYAENESEDSNDDNLDIEWENNYIPQIDMQGLHFKIGLNFFSF